MPQLASLQDQLTFLIQAQALDRVIDDLTFQKESIPKNIQRHADSLKAEEQISLTIKKEIEESQRARRQDELEVETKNTHIKKLNAQLFEVKTNKEYQAMQSEIEGAKTQRAKAEDGVLQKMMAEDEKKIELAKAQEQFKRLEQEFKTTESALKVKLADIERELAVKLQERVGVVQHIEGKILGIYERIRKNTEGVALAQIQGGTCGACYMSIRPQLRIEISKQSELIFCDNCARILYL